MVEVSQVKPALDTELGFGLGSVGNEYAHRLRHVKTPRQPTHHGGTSASMAVEHWNDEKDKPFTGRFK